MGSFAPVFLAFLLNCVGINIFREPKPGCEPLVSCLIFMFAVFLLLWDLRLYPSSLRRLWRCGALFVEFLIAMFLIEHILNDFWFPLEAFVIVSLPKIAQFEMDLLAQGGYKGSGILQFLKSPTMAVVASYLLSIFFLMAVLHTTRIVDFRLLSCGIGPFIQDITLRAKRFKCRLMKTWSKSKVRGKEKCRKARTRRCAPRPDSDLDNCYLNYGANYKDEGFGAAPDDEEDDYYDYGPPRRIPKRK